MPRIQITAEISSQLGSLRNAVTANVAFERAQQLTFEDNRLPALSAYRSAIQRMGRLASRYQGLLERDVANCEQIVENARTRDQLASVQCRASM